MNYIKQIFTSLSKYSYEPVTFLSTWQRLNIQTLFLFLIFTVCSTSNRAILGMKWFSNLIAEKTVIARLSLN